MVTDGTAEARMFCFDGIRDGNGSGRAITRSPAKRLQVEIYTHTRTRG
jgi:hypothetical protein